MRRQVLVALCVLLLAGCSGLGGESKESWEYRIVVENGYTDAQTVTATVETDGGVVVNETRQVAPGERWVVTTLTDDAGSGNYSVAVSTAAHGEEVTHQAGTAGSGATRIILGEGHIVSCGGNVTCYQ